MYEVSKTAQICRERHIQYSEAISVDLNCIIWIVKPQRTVFPTRIDSEGLWEDSFLKDNNKLYLKIAHRSKKEVYTFLVYSDQTFRKKMKKGKRLAGYVTIDASSLTLIESRDCRKGKLHSRGEAPRTPKFHKFYTCVFFRCVILIRENF